MTFHRMAVFCASAVFAIHTAPASAQTPASLWFERADKNKDGFLDADELAKAFRGANAKPIADKPGVKETHADHLFLAAWDANKDGKISRAEYEKYEQKAAAAARSSANRGRVYSRSARIGYRSPLRHRGFGRGVGRGFGTNPYLNMARYQQRAFARQRAAYSNFRRFGAYTPNIRGGHRGVLTHHRGFRRF